jgi:hypothetical protein
MIAVIELGLDSLKEVRSEQLPGASPTLSNIFVSCVVVRS